MATEKQYIFNSETLSYEVARIPLKQRLMRLLSFFGVSLVCMCAYYFLFFNFLGLKTPKAMIVESKNRELTAKLEILDSRIAIDRDLLSEIEKRDNVVYRPIFGMDDITKQERESGFGIDYGQGRLSEVMNNMDALTKGAYIQMRSFEEVQIMASRAGEMAASVPAIFPVSPGGRNKISSLFGYRRDPVFGGAGYHKGIDISGQNGEPVYATGDGVVEFADSHYYGYGKCVVIYHGFGYRSKYAHLSNFIVSPGQKVKKGDQIAYMGSTGKSTGTHLHYEVIYMGSPVNPINFFNNNLSVSEYMEMVRPAK